eukprot:1157665-Pelagomonas_calceolata.AAC.6
MANQHHMQLFNNHKELSALKACELIACGGFSSVYKGLWQGLEVAIKVRGRRTVCMYVRAHGELASVRISVSSMCSLSARLVVYRYTAGMLYRSLQAALSMEQWEC